MTPYELGNTSVMEETRNIRVFEMHVSQCGQTLTNENAYTMVFGEGFQADLSSYHTV